MTSATLRALRRRAWPATSEQLRQTPELLGRSPRRYRDYVAELLRAAEVGLDADPSSALSDAA